MFPGREAAGRGAGAPRLLRFTRRGARPMQALEARSHPVADFRDVFGTIGSRWYNGNVSGLFPEHTVTDLGFLP